MQERLKQMLVEPPRSHIDARNGVCYILHVSSIANHMVIRPLYVMAIAV